MGEREKKIIKSHFGDANSCHGNSNVVSHNDNSNRNLSGQLTAEKKSNPKSIKEDQTEEFKCFVLCQWLVRRFVGVATEPAERAARIRAGKNAAERHAQKKKKQKNTQTTNRQVGSIIDWRLPGSPRPRPDPRLGENNGSFVVRRAQFELHLQRCNGHPHACYSINH